MDSHELPLSHGQRALWFLQRLRPEAAAWNIAAAARVWGRLDAERLRRAFERLTERHDALRLSFHPTLDGPVQRLHPGGRLDFREAEWEEDCLQEEAERPFDLEKDPLLRVRLVRTGGDDVLLLVIHHLVADLGSLAVIVRELGPLYDGTFDGPPPVPFAAFRERLEERHWEYWRKRLAGELPVCELPADRPRPAARTFRGGTRTRRMELAGSRMFPFLVTGLDVLLHRASGQTDLLVGSPTSGRLAPELDGTVGYLVNPVVLRSDLSGSPTFGQLLEQVRGVVLGALRHREYPFPLMVERLRPERDPARPPVFQVMLSFQRAHLEGTGDLAAFALGIEGAVVRTGSLVLESLPLERRSSQLDLELMAAETSRGLELALTFNADLFEPATAERLLGHLETLLEAAARDPERRIGELPLLSPAERQQLLEWNATDLPLPERSVTELFEEQAARTPEALAVNGMTYRGLSERSEAMARSLSGLSPEEPVPVRMERGAELAVALLGILKAGGVYLPLNPSHPEARLARMVELSGARRVLGRGSDSLAYLLFTSGSTGDPKGALVPHRGLLNHLLSKIRGLGLSPADRVAQTAPQSFDIHIWQLLAPLLAGARVEILPDETVRDPARLLAEIGERGITVLQVVPSLLAPLLDEVEKGGGESLRILVTIGEALPPELARRWLAARPGVPLVNNYGPTECADGVSDAWLLSTPEGETHTSIGRPIANMRLHVLSPDLEPQPIGFSGEVCIAGAGVSRGYLGDPARTAAAFVPDPFATGGRLYRTGDLGRRRPDGELEILGRLDHQIKLRGVRIEPGEIEAALASHPGVREAVVALRDGRLAAWWTGDPDAAAELREHLRQQLPEAMVPALFQRLDALPLTAHGKLDRRALPDLVPAAPSASPADEMAQFLAGIFGAVLGRDRVGPRDDFFALGGHSLLAAQVVARVREALEIEPPLSLLFEEPTAAGLAERLRSQAGLPPAPPIRRAAREGSIPLSFAQQGLWFLHRLAPESPACNMPGLVRLPGSVNPAALAASLSAVLARHEALRTTFPAAGGEPYQEIGPAVPVPVPVVDLSALPDADREARRLAFEEGRRPFDLARGPLLRALLLRLGPEEQRLVLVLHHIVADGWSLGVLARETSALLRGEALPELALQYADYADWQRRWPAERLDRLLAWWTGRLAGLTPLELPTDRPRPAARSFRGGLVSIPLPPGLSALARGRKATPFLLTLAAWQILLHRLAGQEDVAVGSPVANRSRRETEGLIGLFADNLVLRADLSGEPTFAEALARVRESALLALAHQDLPFERLAAELAPERDSSRPPLVQVAFSLQEAMPPLDLGRGLRGEIEDVPTGASRLDLWLQVDRKGEGWSASAEYAADLFDAVTVRRWLSHLRVLLEGLMEGIPPDMRISGLPLLSPEEIAELTSWNRTTADIPAEPVHHLFRRWAERAPDALAIAWPGGRLTYGELARQTGGLASRLRAQGAGPETVVALRLERSPELVIASLAVLEAGGAYLPVDPANPEERARWILEDSGARIELTPETMTAAGGGEAVPPAAVEPDSLAYVIYTSGSTGAPKGTELRHRGLSNLIAWHCRAHGLRPSDRIALLTSPGFDASVLEIWAALASGASLHVAPPETVLSPAGLLAWMARERITVLNLTTPLAEAVLAEATLAPKGLALRILMAGGDRLRLRPAPGLPFDVINCYGPTENTVDATTSRVAPQGERLPDIGSPIANTRAWVLDRNLRLLPVGVAGELCLAGEGLARAYRGRPGLTAERFVPDPFGQGERLYRTGDLACWLPEGTLRFLGRIDNQVKIRGVRVELGEIEAALRQCPGVREAAVVMREDRLVAYHAPEQEPGRLREGLRSRLPEVMVPAAFAAVETLPLTPSGKIDRRALPDPVTAAEADGAPLGPIEEAVAEVWSSVLGIEIEAIGRHGGFFELGGHSLLATRVMSRVNQVFRTDLPLRALFEAPTVAGLALLVSSAGRDQLPMPAFRRVPRGQPLAPSFAQERLWVIDRLVPDSPVYNVFQALDVSGPLDEAALERAFAELARRHETLRTRFAIVQGRPLQVVEPHRPRPLAVADLRGLPPHLREEEADRLAREEARRPFDLLRGPLLRFGLLRLGESSRLLLNLHHILCDGWSVDLLAREVGALYRGQPLPELPFQYADYADWQRRWPAELLEGQLAWWKERLAGLATLEIPADFPRPPVQTFRGGMVLATLPADLPARLRELGRARHATPFMLLLAGWQVLLHRITGQEDVAVGVPVANRNWPEIEGLAGFFANNLVLRADLSGEPGFAEALERVRETALSAFSRQDLPFERLVAELAPERDPSRSPVFQVAFSFQEALAPLDLGAGLRGRILPTHTGTSKFDLGLHVEQEREGWVLRAEYAADLFEAATARRWLAHLRALLEEAAVSPEMRIPELPLLSAAERHHLLQEWNDTGGSPDTTIHQLVEEQAARTPDAVAVLFGEKRLTYSELNARADALADRLLALGVQPEARVALLAERSPEMIVALLAILKAGAAYAPLDPELPAERLAFLLDDLLPPVVLAQERLLPRLPACAAAVVLLEDDGPLPPWSGESPRPPRPAVLPDSLAYVLYTSGSTGRPKGVAAVHRGVVRLVREGGFADLGPSRTLLQLAPLSFDASTLEIWGALVNGGRLVVFPPGVPAFEALGETIARHGVDTLWLTAALFHRVVDEKPSVLLPVRQLLAGGDVLSPPHVRKALALRPGGVVINGYGPTESTTFTCCHTMTGVDGVREPVSLGRPIGGTRVYVLDRHLQPAPVGVPGELFIGGGGLARGYHGRPDLTAERFLPDFLAQDGRLYRTGDLARWLPDGNLQFLGRIDRQVKIRGIRVEPEEIETVLRRHPGVRDTVVLVREDRPNDRRLVAWYVAVPEQEPSSEQLRAWLRGKLPEPMVPAAFVILDVLPMTPSGKIDRRALPAPAAGPVAPAAAPRTPLESLVAGVCSEVLGIGEVPRDVSFFDLGGNSLLATQVVTLLQDVLPVELDLRQVLESPTVARMAEIAEEKRRALAEPERLAMDEILAELERSLT